VEVGVAEVVGNGSGHDSNWVRLSLVLLSLLAVSLLVALYVDV